MFRTHRRVFRGFHEVDSLLSSFALLRVISPVKRNSICPFPCLACCCIPKQCIYPAFFSCNRSKDCPRQEPGMTSQMCYTQASLSDSAARSRFEKARFLRYLNRIEKCLRHLSKIHTIFGVIGTLIIHYRPAMRAASYIIALKLSKLVE